MKKLTIGIPTYKRPAIVGALVKQMVEEKITDYVDILLIDDGPSAGLQELLKPFNNDVKLIIHSENQGYAKTFTELFELCVTDYLLVTADDDDLIAEGIKEIINYLESNEPAFLSTVWLKGGKMHRGKNQIAKIDLSHVGQASNHAPGLVYKVSKVKPHLGFLKSRLLKACQVSFFYPQVIVLYILLLRGEVCLWHPAAAVKEGAGVGTNLKDVGGNTYYSISGRWQVYISMIDMFDQLMTYDLPLAGVNALNSIKHIYKLNAYERINFAIRRDFKEYMPVWIAGSIIYNLKKPMVTIRYVFAWISTRRKHKKLLLKNEQELSNQTFN